MRIDLLHLARSLRRSPASAAAAVLTLSVTLGVAASIAAIVDVALFTPPPFQDPDSLVIAGETPIDDPATAPRAVDAATFRAWQTRAAGLATLEAFDGTNLTLTEVGPAERVSATDVTPGFLSLLGVVPALGRAFGPEDGGQRVVIVGHQFWRGKLGADPDIIGRRIVLGAEPYTVVGVLPERFVFELDRSDVLRPFQGPGGQPGPRVRVVARLREEVPSTGLRAALDEVSRAGRPSMRGEVIQLNAAISGAAATTVTLLAVAAIIALAVAFANLAGLLFVRAIDRRRELAIRAALGARRWEVARQLLLEAQALAVIGIVGGVFLALWFAPVAGRLALQQFGGLGEREVVVTWQVLTSMAGAALACAWVCALIPAFAAARGPGVHALGRGTTPGSRERAMRRIIVTAEVALAFVLLASLAILGRSLLDMLRSDPGFDPRNVWALQVSLPPARYRAPADVVSFYSTLQAALSDRLGRGAASMIDEIPLTGDGGRRLVNAGTGRSQDVVLRAAAPGYFDVMRIPVLAGRVFEAHDDAASPQRAVVSAALASSLFGSGPAPGRQIRLTAEGPPVEIVGVVGDVAHRALSVPPVPTVYLPALQAPSHSAIVVVRAAADHADPAPHVRDVVARLDAAVPVYRVRRIEDVLAASPGVPVLRVLAASFGAFAVLAIVLAATGLFGIVSHDAAARRLELAVRAALGAGPRRIARTLAGQSAWMLAVGLAVGSGLTLGVTRALAGAGLLAGAVDLAAFAAAAAALTAAALLAVVPPVVRATRSDRLVALRSD